MAHEVFSIGVLVVAAVCPILMISLIIHGYRLLDRIELRWEAAREKRAARGRPRLVPVGRPIEQIAADARRLGTRLDGRDSPRGVSYARFEATRQAYDDVLIEGCRALGIEVRFGACRTQVERNQHRRNLEFQLEEAGFFLRNAS